MEKRPPLTDAQRRDALLALDGATLNKAIRLLRIKFWGSLVIGVVVAGVGIGVPATGSDDDAGAVLDLVLAVVALGCATAWGLALRRVRRALASEPTGS